MKLKKNKIFFFDRDGTLIFAPKSKDNKPKSIKNITQIKYTKGIKKLILLIKKDYYLVMITNQPEYERKENTKKNIIAINKKIKKDLKLDKVYTCFSDNNKNYDKKPNPGMVLKALKFFKIKKKNSIFLGDRWKDIDAGNRSGIKTIFLDHNYNEKLRSNPSYIVNKISAVYKILKNEKFI